MRQVEDTWTAALDCPLGLRRLIKAPSEGERFYPHNREIRHSRQIGPMEEEQGVAWMKTKKRLKSMSMYVQPREINNGNWKATCQQSARRTMRILQALWLSHATCYITRFCNFILAIQRRFQLDMLHSVYSLPPPSAWDKVTLVMLYASERGKYSMNDRDFFFVKERREKKFWPEYKRTVTIVMALVVMREPS